MILSGMVEEASVSEPPMKCRKLLDNIKTGGWPNLRDQLGRCLRRPSGIRHIGGANPNVNVEIVAFAYV
jgi:hypothetical protein